MSKEITLASGAVITMKPWRVQDVTKLAKYKRASAAGIQALMKRCTDEVVDPGPYKLKDGKLNWEDVYVGDQLVSKLGLFLVTFGDQSYEPRVTCPSCDGKMYVPIGMDEYLRDYVIPYPEETITKLREGDNRFELTVGKTQVIARILNGERQKWSEKHLRSASSQEDKHARLLGLRVVEIDGDSSRTGIVNTINGWSGKLMNELTAALDTIDGGVDTEVTDIECVNCGVEFDFDLPFDGELFWTPSQRTIKEKRSGRTRKALREAEKNKNQTD